MESRIGAGRIALLASGISAILASTCCLGPLILLTLGVSGAWIGNLTVLAPYQPIFIGTASVMLIFVWRRVWRPAVMCGPEEVCVAPRTRLVSKVAFCVIVALLVMALAFPAIAPWFY